jgi:hypothetical protein
MPIDVPLSMTAYSVLQVILGYLRGWSPEKVLLLANAVGAATATHEGAGQNVARLQEVLSLLQASKRNPAAVPLKNAAWNSSEDFETTCSETLELMQASADALEV